jgi:hypothetical protein
MRLLEENTSAYKYTYTHKEAEHTYMTSSGYNTVLFFHATPCPLFLSAKERKVKRRKDTKQRTRQLQRFNNHNKDDDEVKELHAC